MGGVPRLWLDFAKLNQLHPYEIILLLSEDVIILAEFLSKEGKLVAKLSGLGEEV